MKDNGLKFDANAHKYMKGGYEYVSVTTLLKAMGLAPDLSGVDPAVLKAAAEYGNAKHDEVEQALLKGVSYAPIPEGLKLVGTEEMLSDDEFRIAGRYDLLMNNDKGDAFLIDIKCTSTPPKDYCSYQLAIYRYMLGLPEDTSVMMLWLPKAKYGAPAILPMRKHTNQEVRRLLMAYRNGTEFVPDKYELDISDEERKDVVAVAELAERLKAAEEGIKAVKAKILALMIENGQTTVRVGDWNFTAVAESERTSLDSAKLKAELPSIAEKYSKTSKVAPSLRIARAKR